MDQANETASTFGELLLRHRRVAGLTQEALSEASGLSVRAVRDLERGRAQAAQRRSVEALADALTLTGDSRAHFLAMAAARRRATRAPRDHVSWAPPPALPDLVGRDKELALLRGEAAGGRAVAIAGEPGVGKTALAMSAAHELRDAFPDGCLAIDLRGMDDRPVSTRAALDGLLRGLGVPESEVHASEVELAALFRTLLEGRRVFVLLDNAADEAQVRPLVVSAPGCFTVITCRHTLAGLEAARWLRLEPLVESDAIALLAAIVGADRVAAEPDAAAELVGLCGHLPLAVRIAGNRLATRPHWSPAYLVGQMRDESNRLSLLSVGDLRVRSAIEMSYRRLSPEARQAFRRLAALPGVDFGVELAEATTGLTLPHVHVHLDELADTSLLQPALVSGRYRFHDLIRIFAAELLETDESTDERDRLRAAVLDHLLATATAAGSACAPDAPDAARFASSTEAAEWLTREESHWVAATREAAALGRHREVLDLATAMHWYSDRQWGAPWDDVFRLGVAAARALDSKHEEAKLLNFLGWAQHRCLDDYAAALDTHRAALAVACEVGDLLEQTWAHGYLATTLNLMCRPDEALPHAQLSCDLADALPVGTLEPEGLLVMRLSIRNRLGAVLAALGRHAEALAVHRALLSDTERIRDVGSDEMSGHVGAMVRISIGRCLAELRDWREAARTFREATQVLPRKGNSGPMATALLEEGIAWRKAGEPRKARACFEEATVYSAAPPSTRWRQRLIEELATLPEV